MLNNEHIESDHNCEETKMRVKFEGKMGDIFSFMLYWKQCKAKIEIY